MGMALNRIAKLVCGRIQPIRYQSCTHVVRVLVLFRLALLLLLLLLLLVVVVVVVLLLLLLLLLLLMLMKTRWLRTTCYSNQVATSACSTAMTTTPTVTC